MHLIGFSHHYTKMHGQTHGLLLSVQSTKPLGYRPDKDGLLYDSEYETVDWQKMQQRLAEQGSRSFCHTGHIPPRYAYYPLSLEDFNKPLLQLVFIGREHQIPFTTYREFPKNYKPLYPHSRSYRKDTPYSDLIGDLFAFKFKGEKLPQELDFLDSQMSNGLREEYVKIFN